MIARKTRGGISPKNKLKIMKTRSQRVPRALVKIITLLHRTAAVLLGLAAVSGATAQVPLQGNLSGILTQGIYQVVSNLVVPTNQTLVIEAGAVLKFETNTSLTVAGTLNAIGEAANRIVFTCAATTPQAGSWLGIVITKTASTGTTSVLNHVEVSFAENGIAVRGSGPSLLLADSAVCNSRSMGISADASGFLSVTDLQIFRTQVWSNGTDGVFARGYASGCSSSDSGVTLEDCDIAFNGQSGVNLSGSGSPIFGCSRSFSGDAQAVLRRTTVHHNRFGISAAGYAGFHAFGFAGLNAENSLVVSNSSAGILMVQSVGGRIMNNIIAHNGAYGIQQSLNSSDAVQIRNNIVVNNGNGISASSLRTNAVNNHAYNLVFGNVTNNWRNYPSEFGILSTTNLNGTPADAHLNISSDPLFQGAEDLHLRFESPAVNAGSAISAPSADYAGAIRDFTPDLGLYEVIAFTQPTTQIFVLGDSAMFEIQANVSGDITYQWQHNGFDILDATNSTFVIPSTTSIDAGGYRVVITTASGSVTTAFATLVLQTVVAWGAGSATNVPIGLHDVKAVTATDYHSVALKNDGSVLVWGLNTSAKTVPIAAQSGVVAIAAAGDYILALKNNGSVIGWGDSGRSSSFVPNEALSGVTAISASPYQSVAVKNDGTVVAWGLVFNGSVYVPATVPGGLSNVVAVGAGLGHTIVLKSDGTVVAWGLNNAGQAAVPLAAQSDVKAIAAGHYHNVVLKNDGTVVAWGINNSGQITVPLMAQTGVRAISVGGDQNIAIKTDGTLVAWGVRGQAVPTNLPEVRSVAVGGNGGGNHIVAILGNLVDSPVVHPEFSNGQFSVRLLGATNHVWIIQASIDFLNWVQISRVTNITGTVSIPDGSAINYGRRFYRAVSP